MTQTIVLYRLVGTVEVTFNLTAAIEVDLFQLRQGLEAREVACCRNVSVWVSTWKTFPERSVVALRQHLL